ncbi:MAG: hypothetical protein K6U87_11150 [Firmicutes bacterium]|nr:hypothetical protein [Bacillota bacterium]
MARRLRCVIRGRHVLSWRARAVYCAGGEEDAETVGFCSADCGCVARGTCRL